MFGLWIRGSRRRKSGAGRRFFTAEPLEGRVLLSGAWTRLTQAAPGPVGTMLLLPDGSVMSQINGTSSDWARLTPDSSGSYINGSWTRLAPARYTRLYGASQVLPNGNVFVAGGEYGTGGRTGEVYSPQTNTWIQLPPQNFGNLLDSSSEVLPNGHILIAPVSPSGDSNTILFDPSSDTWSAGPKLFRGSTADEQSWVKLADDSIITIDGRNTSERYIPSQNKWVNDASVPVSLWDSIGEIGAGVLLADGRAFFIGASGHTALYTPSGTAVPGSWAAGPDIPNGKGAPDAPAAVLPDGTVLCAVGTPGTYNGPTSLYVYDPVANSFSPVAGAPSISAGPYVTRMLDLPDGTVLLTTGGAAPYVYNDGTASLPGAKPTISANQLNADGTYQLTGTEFNGNSEGAYYGDDVQMNSNYPLVRLTGSTGQVYFARSFNWSSNSVQTGNSPVTTQYALPLGLPSDTYSVSVAVNGFVSDPVAITVPSAGYTAAPVVAAAPQPSPAVVSGNTTQLSVLATDPADAESKLTYTWTVVSAPAGAHLPSFSDNGTNSAKSTTATFYQAGAYTFDVYVTDAGGLWSKSTTTVTVAPTPGSITVIPSLATITGSTTEQFNASGTDQFNQPMFSIPQAAWTVTSGGGTIGPAGLYTAPATGTLATITASAGTAQGSATVGVVTPPWSSRDIGPVNIPGQSYDTAGVFTLEGSGTGIGSTTDQYRFTYQAVNGNADITARLVSQTNTSPSALSGVMIRNSLDPADAFAMLAINPASNGSFEYRNAKGAAALTSSTGSAGTPSWIRLVRNGSTLIGFTSADGTAWTQVGSVSIPLNSSVYVGLVTCSSNNSALDTAAFDNVTVSQPLIATPASSGSNPISSVALSVLGADAAGESQLRYTWAATNVPAGAGMPTFSANGTNAAKNTVATLSLAGTYTFAVTVSDPSGLAVTSITSVIVNPLLTSVAVTPATASVVVGGTVTLSAGALDQFGRPMSPPAGFTWSVTGEGNSISAGVLTAGNIAGAYTVSATAGAVTGTAPVTISSTVKGRYVFYNNSAFDGSDPAADARDDRAIDPTKQPLLLGGTAAPANYTSYSRGINGIMIDVAGLPGMLSASDLSFRAGTTADPAGWSPAPAPSTILVRPGAGIDNSARVELTWPDGSIRNQWLQMTVLADGATGLAAPDVFYFGNLVGSTLLPPQGGAFTVSAADVASVRGDPHTFLSPADVGDGNDLNHDGRVDALDQLIARGNSGASIPVLVIAPTPLPRVNAGPASLARRRRVG